MSEFDEMNSGVVEEFRANGGAVGGALAGHEVILVHHIGARSGIERVIPLVRFGQQTGDTVIVASGRAGASRHPQWYVNLMARPRVTVEAATGSGVQTYLVDVTEIAEPDRTTRWREITTGAPLYAEYDRLTLPGRTIPLLLLTRVDTSSANGRPTT